jgi:hypothetical protein
MTSEPLNPESFVDLALNVVPLGMVSLVVAVLDDRGVPAAELVVISDLPCDAADRSAMLADVALWFRATAIRPWRYLAHAVVEPTDDDRLAALAIIAEP